MIGRLPLDEQLVALKSVLSRNEVLLEVLHRTAGLALRDWYVTAGCLFQTLWNVATDRHPTSGIKDYDVFCFDDHDLSWEAEGRVIKPAAEAFAGLPADVEVRNEARVHLWYEQKFGVACAPYTSTEAAIDSFAATTCCLGVRLEPGGQWRVYAPHGPRRRVQSRCPAQSRACPAPGVRDEDGPLAAAVAGADRSRLAFRARHPGAWLILRGGVDASR